MRKMKRKKCVTEKLRNNVKRIQPQEPVGEKGDVSGFGVKGERG